MCLYHLNSCILLPNTWYSAEDSKYHGGQMKILLALYWYQINSGWSMSICF